MRSLRGIYRCAPAQCRCKRTGVRADTAICVPVLDLKVGNVEKFLNDTLTTLIAIANIVRKSSFADALMICARLGPMDLGSKITYVKGSAVFSL